jgi:hypothetical protein
MKVNELLQEYISRETFNSVVKKACLKHGIKTGVRTTTEFDHDKGTLTGTIFIKIPGGHFDATERKYVDVDFGKFNQDVIDSIILACEPYGVSSIVEPHNRYAWAQPNKFPLTTKFDLNKFVQSGEEVMVKLIFGAEVKTDFDSVFAEEKRELEELISNWQSGSEYIGTHQEPHKWMDWQGVGTPGMALMPNFEKGLLNNDQAQALKNMTDDPDMLKSIQDRHDRVIGSKLAQRMVEIEKQKNILVSEIKKLLAEFNQKTRTCKAVLTVIKTPIDEQGGPLNTRSVHYSPEDQGGEVPQIKVAVRKDIAKFDKSQA